MNGTLTRLNWRSAARVWVGLLVFLSMLPGLHAIILPPIRRWSNPTPHGANVYDMAYIGGTYVQVGECGQVFTSEDAQTWVPPESGTTLALRSVTLFGGRAVITGENGTVLVSENLTDFFPAGVNTTNWLEGVAASSNIVVAVGDNAAIYMSTNGLSWQPVTGLSFNYWLSGVAYGTNTFVVVGENGLIATSPDGTTWTRRTSGTTMYLNGVAWVGNQFMAVGEGGKAFSSPNGTVWQAVTTGATNALYASSGTTNSLLVAGNVELRLRETASWSNELSATLLSSAPSWPYYTTIWDGAGYFAAGSTGLTTESYKTNSTTQWTTETNSIRIWLWQVARTPSNYVAVGDLGTILTSPDGIDWDVELTPASATNSVLLGVGGSISFFLAVGSQGTVLWATNTFLWNALASRPTTNDLQGVCFDGSRFILCGGNGTILTSNNGTNWMQRTTPTNVFLMSVEAFPGGGAGGGGRLRGDSDEPRLDQLGAPDLGHHQLAFPSALPQWAVAGREGKRHHPRQHQRHQLDCAYQRRQQLTQRGSLCERRVVHCREPGDHAYQYRHDQLGGLRHYHHEIAVRPGHLPGPTCDGGRGGRHHPQPAYPGHDPRNHQRLFPRFG
jgi:hypothetical protein